MNESRNSPAPIPSTWYCTAKRLPPPDVEVLTWHPERGYRLMEKSSEWFSWWEPDPFKKFLRRIEIEIEPTHWMIPEAPESNNE